MRAAILEVMLDFKSGEANKDPASMHDRLDRAKEMIDGYGIERHPDGSLVGSSLLDESGTLKYWAVIGELMRREAEALINGEQP